MVNGCRMRKKNGESVDHPKLHCEIAYALWGYIFSLYELKWVLPRQVVDLFDCWGGSVALLKG
jgi:hypothetical protein